MSWREDVSAVAGGASLVLTTAASDGRVTPVEVALTVLGGLAALAGGRALTSRAKAEGAEQAIANYEGEHRAQ